MAENISKKPKKPTIAGKGGNVETSAKPLRPVSKRPKSTKKGK